MENKNHFTQKLCVLREKIDQTDQKIQDLLETRIFLVMEIQNMKKDADIPRKDPKRENEIFEKIKTRIKTPYLQDFVCKIYKKILKTGLEELAKHRCIDP